ncbi:MAG TPA: hypothetical protein PKC67_02840 [Kiritimatiellia bacterium]|nr:hypothetical protein [Kiritimatiellia bacterium]
MSALIATSSRMEEISTEGNCLESSPATLLYSSKIDGEITSFIALFFQASSIFDGGPEKNTPEINTFVSKMTLTVGLGPI